MSAAPSESVSIERVSIEGDGQIAVITVDNPPVNAISQAVRQGLQAAMAELAADSMLKGGVILGAGRVFIAGADVREFGKPPLPPSLPETIDAIESCPKPVVAAIHGVALGGGLEIALGCHYRILDPKARVGLPEVTLGLIPGAGGTQRLPRLIPIDKALDLVSTGRQVGAREALELGLADAVAEGDLRDAAMALLRERLDAVPPRISQRPAKRVEDTTFFDTRKAEIARRARGQESPIQALEAIRAASELPFEAGMKAEREIFLRLRDSDQAKALRHVFFAERAVSRIPGLEGVTPRTVEQVGVIGGGTMGAGIAVACLNAGLSITLIEADDAALERGKGNIARALDGYVSRGRMTEEKKQALLDGMNASTDYGALAGVDLVIEAVFEDLDVKRQVFSRIDAVARPGAILATNTSYLDINAIAAATKRPQDVIGLHFFAPANIMRLLEIVRPESCADDVVATGFSLAKALGKTGVLSGVCDGFIGNRILAHFRKQADAMLEDGALPWDIDRAMESFGMPMGPFRVMDMSGLDISWAQRKRLAATRDPRERYVRIADRLCEQGWFGQKTGRGWYLYKDGKPEPNPDVVTIIEEESAARNITRRAIPDEEIQQRILYAMINEGARILEEGIAQRPLDIDIVEIFGYGFPRWRGGPMCQADLIGLAKVHETIRRYAETDPQFWTPSPLFDSLVATGKPFSSLNEG